MKILITGSKGLGLALSRCYSDHDVTMVSLSTGHNIAEVNQWGHEFLSYDLIFNNAYQAFDQIKVLEFFFNHWRYDSSKTIVTIGSRSASHTRSGKDSSYWPYQIHKKALQTAHDATQYDSECVTKIINPGMIDTLMVANNTGPKFQPDELASRIRAFVEDPTIKRVDLWLGKL